ncbi:hypothetical protein EVAR_98395_1 [Eumeta japonica]|uniref:Uncharacterized protein n=1 Tax=Eumeta variegata TaxID=151549 RepID=A0A4C1XRR7_EUMVA|nr:hypothetical protein EVAR_98395_1 [Eumeta japonica]
MVTMKRDCLDSSIVILWLKHKEKCSYCSRGGATLGCNISQCKKQFHLPCGREHNAVSLFHGNYKSFCGKHAPKQKIPAEIMIKANQRVQFENRLKKKKIGGNRETSENEELEEIACVICYETVPGYPSTETFWLSCCGKDAWFHRTCLQRMSLASGMHYLKCPLCNDKDNFYRAVLEQGYYVPDRDAAWELEANAFAEIYERPSACAAAECRCCLGREHDADNGSIWELKLCLLCGSSCVHGGCLSPQLLSGHYVCTLCQTVEPPDLDKLAATAVAAGMFYANQAHPLENADSHIHQGVRSVKNTRQMRTQHR